MRSSLIGTVLTFFNILHNRRGALIVNVSDWWECHECSLLLYMAASVVIAYYPNLALFNDHNNLPFWKAVADHSVFFMSFVFFALYCWLCTANGSFSRVEHLCQVADLVSLFQDVLDPEKLLVPFYLSVVAVLIVLKHTWSSVIL